MNIVEFAKSLNLSIATVSRALNDRPEVSPATRKLVLAKAQELGFLRNANARRLVTGRTNLIRLECPYNTHILSDLYLVEMARAIEESAGAYGYDLLLHLGTRQRQIIEAQDVDGLVVIASPTTTADDIEMLTSRGQTPAVVITGGAPLDLPMVSYICLDTLSGLRQALEQLFKLGHRHVGYIGTGLIGDRISAELPDLMKACGLDYDPELMLEADQTQELGFQAATKLLTLPRRPTALFARTDILAAAAVQAATQLNLTVPNDLSIVGHDNIELAALVNPPLTTIAINIPTIADAAIKSLIATMTDQHPPAVQVLGTELIVRQSIAPAPAM